MSVLVSALTRGDGCAWHVASVPSPDFLPLVGTEQPKVQPWYRELCFPTLQLEEWALDNGLSISIHALRKEKGGHPTPEVWSVVAVIECQDELLKSTVAAPLFQLFSRHKVPQVINNC